MEECFYRITEVKDFLSDDLFDTLTNYVFDRRNYSEGLFKEVCNILQREGIDFKETIFISSPMQRSIHSLVSILSRILTKNKDIRLAKKNLDFYSENFAKKILTGLKN